MQSFIKQTVLVDEKRVYNGCFFFRSEAVKTEFDIEISRVLEISHLALSIFLAVRERIFFHPLLQPRESFILSCLNSFLSPYDELRKFLGCISNDV